MELNLKTGEYLGRNLKSVDNDFFKLSLTSYEPNSATVRHYHENDYISILVGGRYYEKNKAENNLINAGDILFRPNAYCHENLFGNVGGACFNIEFKTDWQRRLDIQLGLPDKFINYKTGQFSSLYKLLVNFENQYNADLTSEYICDWLFQINEKSVAKGNHPWLEKIIQILVNETDQYHSLQSLSERVFVHPIYLSRAFKEKLGVTIGEYQLKAKLENAILLLFNTALPISEIAHKNGFFDDAHFIRSFKSVYHISPNQFRVSIKKLI